MLLIGLLALLLISYALGANPAAVVACIRG